MMLMFPSEHNHSHQITHSARWRGRLKTMWKRRWSSTELSSSAGPYIPSSMVPWHPPSPCSTYTHKTHLFEKVVMETMTRHVDHELNTHLNHVLIFFMIQTANLLAAVKHRYRCDLLCITILALLGKWGNYIVYLHGYNDFSVNKRNFFLVQCHHMSLWTLWSSLLGMAGV